MFKQITKFKNLLKAYRNASKAKDDRLYVQKYNYDLEYNLLELQKKLNNQTYKWGKYKTFYVYDPKMRLIKAAPFEDRIVHHAIHNIIEPIFEKTFIKDSYACRKNKGTHKALLRTFEFTRANKYYLQCDIRKYFDSINGEILFSLLKKEISNPKLLKLLKDLILSGIPSKSLEEHKESKLYLFSEKHAESKCGLPLGNLTSQLFANIYLNELDHFIKEKLSIKHYVRYMDDFVIFGNSKKSLWKIKDQMENFLDVKLKLRLHPKKIILSPTYCALDFLGYKTYPNKILLRRRNLVNYFRRTKKHKKQLQPFLPELQRIHNLNANEKVKQEIWDKKVKNNETIQQIIHSRASFLGIVNYLYPKDLRDYWFEQVFSHPFNILVNSIKSPASISYPFVERNESL